MKPVRIRLLYLAFGLSGAAALADEVVWTRYLQLVLGSSVYAVAAMLSAFMTGLALGGVLGGKFGDRVKDPLRTIALLELGIGASALLTLLLLGPLTELHLWVYQRFALHPLVYFSADALLALPLVLLPTTLMGATFPLVARAAAGGSGEQVARVTGLAYAANTTGAIIGSALAGFVAIPLFGLVGTLVAAASVNLLAAALVLFSGGRRPRSGPAAGAVVAVLLLGLLLPEPAAPVGYYLAGRATEDPEFPARLAAMSSLYRRWAPEGLVEVREDGSGGRVLIVDGRIEGGSRTRERTTQDLLALAPGAARGLRERVFLIGLGIGRTLATHHSEFPSSRLEVAEVNPAVIEAVDRYFLPDHPALPERAIDGRLQLQLPGEAYDAIISGPSFPVDATSGGLFTLEFFEIVARRLTADGVFVGWMPGYLLDPEQERALVATVVEALPHLRVFELSMNEDLVIVASSQPLPSASQMIETLMRIHEPYWGKGALRVRLGSDPEVAELLARGAPPRLATDDDPWLELAMARNLVRGRAWLRR